MWQALVANLAVVALFVTGWNLAQPWLEGRSWLLRRIVFALLMSVGAVGSMLLAIELQSGVIVDLRSSMIATAGFFGGPVSGSITIVFAALYRLLLGGHGVWAGLTSICLSGAVGIGGYYGLRGRLPRVKHILALAATVTALTLTAFAALPEPLRHTALAQFALPLGLLSFIATVVSSLTILHTLVLTRDRDLLQAALAQSPDFQYIKNRRGEFVAVNEAVARHNGFARPRDLRGLTDFDITPAERARKLFDVEQQLLKTGDRLVDHEEQVALPDGTERWFSTSKSPLYNADGRPIGLAGVTRDISERKRLETALSESRNELAYALAEMSDGLAMFDRDGRIVYCNDQYGKSFPRTAHLRRPGATLAQILRGVVETKEQRGIPEENAESWIEEVSRTLSFESEQEIELFDGRWIRIRTRPTNEGMSMVTTSDVTRLKEAERVLTTFNEKLQLLADTDALTQLLNRRAFDRELARALADAETGKLPVSLILVDVDHFKAFNDLYGHPAGDGCLKKVAQCLTDATRRHDVAARYGGEEFAVILRGAGPAAASATAERIRLRLERLAIPHEKSAKGIVSISLGIATADPSAGTPEPAALIQHADVALYQAKAGGRDIAMTYRAGIGDQRRARAR